MQWERLGRKDIECNQPRPLTPPSGGQGRVKREVNLCVALVEIIKVAMSVRLVSTTVECGTERHNRQNKRLLANRAHPPGPDIAHRISARNITTSVIAFEPE